MIEELAEVSIGGADEARERAHADDAAAGGYRLDLLVSEVAPAFVHAAGISVADDHRRGAGLDDLEAGAPPDMGHVDDDPELVHPGDRRAAELRQAAVGLLQAAVAEAVPGLYVGWMTRMPRA